MIHPLGTTRDTPSNANYPLTLLFDGACPVCNLEMDNLKAQNTHALLAFIDISAPGFNPAPFGTSLKAMNGLIHAVRPDGSLVIGTEVFRLAYTAVGLGRWAAPSGWPVLMPLLDLAYAAFARHRYGFSNAFMPLLEHLRIRRAAKRAARAARLCLDANCELGASPGNHSPQRSSP